MKTKGPTQNSIWMTDAFLIRWEKVFKKALYRKRRQTKKR